jgi:hypothetical protein
MPKKSATSRPGDKSPAPSPAAFAVMWHPAAERERARIVDTAERSAIAHAEEKLKTLGRLLAPHSSAVQGKDGKGLRELRPRGGRSRWRPIYRQVDSKTFVILAVGPEAQIDEAGFNRAVRDAQQRFGDLEAENPE